MLYKSTHNRVLLLAEKVLRIAVKSIVNTWCKTHTNTQLTTYWEEAQIPF